METLSFATARKGMTHESMAYARAMLNKGYGYQNAARIAGINENTLRELCGAKPRVAVPVPVSVRREPPAPRQRTYPQACLSETTLIIQRVAEKYGFTPADFAGPSRCRFVSYARHEAMAEIRTRRPHLSLPAIGRIFGNRDHTTVLSGIRDHHSRVAWGQILVTFGQVQVQPDLFAVAA